MEKRQKAQEIKFDTMKKYYLLAILLLVVLYFFVFFMPRCSNVTPARPNMSHEEILCSIDTDSIENISALWREADYWIVTDRSIEDKGPLEVYLLKRWNKLYLMYDGEKIKFDKYDKFVFKPKLDSLGLDIDRVKYAYNLMTKYFIIKIASINDVSMVDIDSVRYYHIPDTTYLTGRDLSLKKFNEQWYWEAD